MFRLTLPAYLIPDYTSVVKPTGDALYTLRHKFPVFWVDGVTPKSLDFPKDVLFLVSPTGLNVITKETKLGVSFNALDELQEFIERIKDE